MGGAVSFGLVGRASCGWRRVIGIGGKAVVWVAPVSLGLVGMVSYGWRCVIRIGGEGVVT